MMFTGSLSLVLGGFPIFLPVPRNRELMLSGQADMSEMKYLDYLYCHQSIGGDTLIPFRLHCLADNLRHLAWSSLISPVLYPVISFIVGNLNLPE